jgi:cobalamin biosynthesis protein CobW
MQKLLERETRFDHIIIETSGLALPQPLVRAFKWPEIQTKVTVDGVITVVDGKAVTEGRFAHSIEAVDMQRASDENLDHETPLSELFEDQIACADMIIVNKSDLLTNDQADNLVDQLKQDSRDGVQVLKSERGVLSADIVLGQKMMAENDLENRHELHHHHHEDDSNHSSDDHDHDDFESFIIAMQEIQDVNIFTQKVVKVIKQHDILRLKGFVAVKGKPLRLTIQAVGPRVESYFDKAFGISEERATKIVVIGQKGMSRSKITEALIR